MEGEGLQQHFSNSGAYPLGRWDAVLKGVSTTPQNRYTYAIFIDNDPISCESECEIFSLPMRAA